MNGTTIMLAAAAGLGGYLWWQRDKGRRAAAARQVIHTGGKGAAYETVGRMPVAQAGGIGAGIGAPTETKARVTPLVSATRAAAVATVRSRMGFTSIRPK